MTCFRFLALATLSSSWPRIQGAEVCTDKACASYGPSLASVAAPALIQRTTQIEQSNPPRKAVKDDDDDDDSDKEDGADNEDNGSSDDNESDKGEDSSDDDESEDEEEKADEDQRFIEDLVMQHEGYNEWNATLLKKLLDVPRSKEKHLKDCGVGNPPVPFNSQFGEDFVLLVNFFCGLRDKTFLEIGAFDGVTTSNTKFFEDALGWSGVLIEAQPRRADLLRQNRKSEKNTIINSAVCKQSGTMELAGVGSLEATGSVIGRKRLNNSLNSNTSAYKIKTVTVPCEPMSAMLERAQTKHLALFSLDVEGAELIALESMNWEIPVCVWMVEMLPQQEFVEKNRAVRKLMASKGYESLDYVDLGFINELFVHPDLSGCLAAAP